MMALKSGLLLAPLMMKKEAAPMHTTEHPVQNVPKPPPLEPLLLPHPPNHSSPVNH